MRIDNLKLERAILDINLKLYFFLKNITKSKLTANQTGTLLGILGNRASSEFVPFLEFFRAEVERLLKSDRLEFIISIIELIENETDLELLSFGLRLYAIKDPLLSEAKLVDIIESQAMVDLDPLSMEYDKKSVFNPYTRRVNGALLSLLLFSKIESGEANFLTSVAEGFVAQLVDETKSLKNKGVEPNQIFMLMFTESVNQSIISGSGTNYEDRILSVLHKIGIPSASISKVHDAADESMEFDFFFEIDNRSYGIGAKRTLRERYKQFIKTAISSELDVMIEITLGLDLNEAKAKTIVNHGTVLFVSNEIYQSRAFLQSIDRVYSVKDLNLETLKSL